MQFGARKAVEATNNVFNAWGGGNKVTGLDGISKVMQSVTGARFDRLFKYIHVLLVASILFG